MLCLGLKCTVDPVAIVSVLLQLQNCVFLCALIETYTVDNILTISLIFMCFLLLFEAYF